MGILMDDNGVEQYLWCLGSAVFTASDHFSLAIEEFCKNIVHCQWQRTASAGSIHKGIFVGNSSEFSCFTYIEVAVHLHRMENCINNKSLLRSKPIFSSVHVGASTAFLLVKETDLSLVLKEYSMKSESNTTNV
jgi:hypothetical protein